MLSGLFLAILVPVSLGKNVAVAFSLHCITKCCSFFYLFVPAVSVLEEDCCSSSSSSSSSSSISISSNSLFKLG